MRSRAATQRAKVADVPGRNAAELTGPETEGSPPPASAHVEVVSVHKTYLRVEQHLFSRTWYEDTEALSGVSLDIRRGEFVSIVGPSGCGKTSLLNILGGLDSHTSGAVRVNGVEARGPRDGTAMVFQQVGLLPWRTVTDNVLLGMRLRLARRPTAADKELASMCLQMVGLERFASAYPSKLSGGMQQRVGIARALAVSPDLLLMDEPFGALDFQTRMVLQSQLLRLVDQLSATVVFITHDVDEAIYLSDRVVVLTPRPGRIRSIHEVDLGDRLASGVRGSAEFGRLRRAIFEDLELPR